MARAHKFNASRTTTADGKTFDSQAEADRYLELRIMQDAGLIRGLELQRRTQLMGLNGPILIKSKGYPNGRKASYVEDFRYEQKQRDGEWVLVIEDVKGMDTPVSRLKRAIFEAQTGVPVTIISKRASRRRRAGGRQGSRRPQQARRSLR